MTDKEKLSPCPLCNNPTILVEYDGTGNLFYCICPRCLSTGPNASTEEQAEQSWNTAVEEWRPINDTN